VGVKKLTTPLTLTLSHGVEREEKKGLNNTPHFCSLPRLLSAKGEKRFYLIKSILFVFTNFGAFKV
jgi:hypothetical protein